MSCPKCGGLECTKDGIVQKKQRYKCKSCGYRYTVSYRGISPTIKRQARKSEVMLKYSVQLLMLKWNGQIESIFN